MTNTTTLIDALCTVQKMPEAEAQVIAEKLQRDETVFNAALEWAQSGMMPTTPEIEGHTPKSLSEDFDPSQAFTILLALADHPEEAKKMLRSYRQEYAKDGSKRTAQ